ncbi:SDR family oxidoreductase [Aestuariivivens sediminis]|uniref:SDR family oxidoreductase n=1 Tax=Aestuariivivens sediminis TaxID=2913557 RepID=UPI001F575D99|nr:SDR family oxidoreductase [Aestuariivivens sediminis]
MDSSGIYFGGSGGINLEENLIPYYYTPMEERVKGKNIIVTGATSGIGKSLTLKLLDFGANVAFCGRSEDKMAQLLKEINGKANPYFYKVFDISMEQDIVRFVEQAAERLGEPDILVNCAGLNSAKDLVSDIKTSDLEWMLTINLVAPFIFMREVFKNMAPAKPGVFINVLSTVCNFSNEGIGAYTASKAGYDALCKVFRKEVRAYGKRVCSIYPGGVDSPFREASRPDYLKPEIVADTIIHMMPCDWNSSVDELTIRPMVEKNYI